MSVSLRRAGAIALRQGSLLKGSPARVLPLFAWVAIDIVLWGFLTRYLDRFAAPGLELVPVLLGSVLLWDFLVRVMQGVTTAFFEDVWSRNFLNLFSTPITNLEYVLGLTASSLATSLLGLLVMLALAAGAFGLGLAAAGSMAIPFLLVLLLQGIALGILGTAIVLRLGPASEWLVWPIPALLSPFAAVYYPVASLPAWMQSVSRAIPASHVFEGLRAIVQQGAFDAQGLWLAFGLSVLWLAAAYGIYVRTHRRAIASGLLARYSAESVS